MISLQITALNYDELLKKIEAEVGCFFNPIGGTPTKNIAGAPALAAGSAAASAPAPEATPAVPAPDAAVPAATPVPAPVAAPAAEAPKRGRGRPRLAPSQQHELDKAAQAAAVQPGNPAAQAQVANSASTTAAQTPAAGSAPAAAPAATAPVAAQGEVAAITFDQMKAKLQAVAAKALPDDGKDTNAPLARAAAIIKANGGYLKVKDVAPAHFAVIVAECDKVLAS